MAKQVPWTQKILENFIEKACLSEDEAYIMRSRVKNVPVSRQAMELNKCESSVHGMIATLKKKYDRVQAEYPDEFPVRKKSLKEDYMDSH